MNRLKARLSVKRKRMVMDADKMRIMIMTEINRALFFLNDNFSDIKPSLGPCALIAMYDEAVCPMTEC